MVRQRFLRRHKAVQAFCMRGKGEDRWKEVADKATTDLEVRTF